MTGTDGVTVAGHDVVDIVATVGPLIGLIATGVITIAVLSGKLPLSTLLFRSVSGQKEIDEHWDNTVISRNTTGTDDSDDIEDEDTKDTSYAQAPTWVGVVDLDLFSDEE